MIDQNSLSNWILVAYALLSLVFPANLRDFNENNTDLQEKQVKNKHRPQGSSLTSCFDLSQDTRMVIAEKERQMNAAQGFDRKTSFHRSLES